MQQENFFGMAIRIGLGLGTVLLLAACQEPGHHGAAAESPVASTQAAPLVSAAQTPAAVTAYTPLAAVAKPLTGCNLEYVNATALGSTQPTSLKNKQSNIFKGWIDGSKFTQPSYWLRFDDPSANRYLKIPIMLTIRRPDVQAVEAGAPLVSGFNVNLPVSALPVGHYHVYLAVESGDTIYVCDNGRRIETEP